MRNRSVGRIGAGIVAISLAAVLSSGCAAAKQAKEDADRAQAAASNAESAARRAEAAAGKAEKAAMSAEATATRIERMFQKGLRK